MTWQCVWAAGSLYRLHNGQEMALSIPGCLDPSLDLPYSPASSFPQKSPEPRANVATRSSQAARHCSDLSCKAHDVSLSWQSSSNRLHASSAIHTRHQSSKHEAESSRLFDGSSAASSGSSASVSVSNSSSSSSTGTTVPENKVDSPLNAHFMAMAAKLSYEDPEIVTDCLQHRCSARCLPSM